MATSTIKFTYMQHWDQTKHDKRVSPSFRKVCELNKWKCCAL